MAVLFAAPALGATYKSYAQIAAETLEETRRAAIFDTTSQAKKLAPFLDVSQ